MTQIRRKLRWWKQGEEGWKERLLWEKRREIETRKMGKRAREEHWRGEGGEKTREKGRDGNLNQVTRLEVVKMHIFH